MIVNILKLTFVGNSEAFDLYSIFNIKHFKTKKMKKKNKKKFLKKRAILPQD